jgi:predicted  nucleic acid-binding Zn-ribbon protein
VLKYLASIPVVLSILAGAYGSINYINKLTTKIDDSADQIMVLHKDIENIHQLYSEKTNTNANNYTMAREELVKEITELVTWVGRIEARVNSLEQGSYKLASEAELRAIEQSYYTLRDDINQFKYDLKELERQLSGGY